MIIKSLEEAKLEWAKYAAEVKLLEEINKNVVSAGEQVWISALHEKFPEIEIRQVKTTIEIPVHATPGAIPALFDKIEKDGLNVKSIETDGRTIRISCQ